METKLTSSLLKVLFNIFEYEPTVGVYFKLARLNK